MVNPRKSKHSLGKCSVFHVSIALNASPLTQVPWCHIGGCKLKMRRFEAPKKVNEYIILCTLIYIYILCICCQQKLRQLQEQHTNLHGAKPTTVISGMDVEIKRRAEVHRYTTMYV